MHNNYQRTVFSGYSSSFFGSISSVVTSTKDYFYLKQINDNLEVENTALRNRLEQLRVWKQEHLASAIDTFENLDSKYLYITAGMINSGFNKTKNYITLNKGRRNGISEEMAVCSSEGVVGVVEKVSNYYAKVLPLINVNLKVSAKIKKNGYYGSLQWDGDDYRYSYLNDIPFHVNVEQGDTIVTSGLSSIFPEGKLIGFIESVDKQTANFLSIKVRLATDFKKISDIYVIANTHKKEQEDLEDNSHD